MTEPRKPKPCHHDQALGYRTLTTHRDDCPTHTGDPCPGRDGCAPCTAPHCVLCTRRHLDNTHPLTCPDCIGAVRTDLDDIRWLCRHLRWQAARAGHDGRLAAAAPIPGADAMVLIAPAGGDTDQLRTYPGWTAEHHDKDHRPTDPVPPLLPLEAWAITWRGYLGHNLAARPSVAGITRYLADQLTTIAQVDDGPDWPGFARAMALLRRQLEGVLHDEREPERGVSCFECGDRLVRKFGQAKPCRHRTPARDWLRIVATYPELPPFRDEVLAARRPCGVCDQGGILDPSAGQSWECLGCRKKYTPGEYANAVRRDLLTGGPDGDGWTHITMAAEAASTMTGYLIAANTVRRWMDRTKVASVCRWEPGTAWGLRLVFWPDVADQAADLVERHLAAEARRRRMLEEEVALAKAIAAGEDPKAAGKRIGIHPARLDRLLDELSQRAS